ncbi:hypothetical protein GCM10028805_59950 [Spirosoma harenae]
MKYLIDVQLPYLLAEVLRQKGFDVTHTDELPNKDETSDTVIRQLAAYNDWIVVSKDSDFQDSYLLFKQPPRLLFVTTGNIKNRKLLDLFRLTMSQIDTLFEKHSFIELNNNELIVHE